ncbi:MAG: hypothetical protein GF399_01060 [Candidatus Coatesbacteria bacterium]|nr:hypothetical protein [Candidatus Coatesbacteria bacterium]
MRGRILLVFTLLLAVSAVAMTIRVDESGNMLKVEQRATAELEGGRRAVNIFLEWGNLEGVDGVGFQKFNGFVAPEHGECRVVDVRMFDHGGKYENGLDDKVTHDGPAYVRWRASTVGKTDGLTVRVITNRDTVVHIKVGDWHGEFKIAAGNLVEDSLQESTSVWNPDGPAIDAP